MNLIHDRRVQIGVIILIIAGAGMFFFKGQRDVVTTSKEVVGDLSVAEGKTLVIKSGAVIHTSGNATIAGTVECIDGPATIIAEGKITVTGAINCFRSDETTDTGTAIALVAPKGIEFSSTSQLNANGNVEIVTDKSKLLSSKEVLEDTFNETGTDSGQGPRIGPMIEKGVTNETARTDDAHRFVAMMGEAATSLFPFTTTAHAQVPSDKNGNALPNFIFRGTWHIGEGDALPGGVLVPKPPKGVNHILLHFDLGENGNASLENFHLVGPAGRDGKNSDGTSCDAKGERGEDAFRMRLIARQVTLDNFRLELGNGGMGGNATTKNDCDPGTATGGKGGEAGNFKMSASEGITIKSFHLVPGAGGDGGNATAYGKDGQASCPGTKGGDALATGGDGGRNKKELSSLGAVDGIDNIEVERVQGGMGGTATARPGKGGNGNACNCAGGRGGDGTATGGKGGDATIAIPGQTGEAHGGDGGHSNTQGGIGGNGGSCQGTPTGGAGGDGGNADASFGSGGKGTTAQGQDGEVKQMVGGNGGNGGDGCGPGKGGKGGLGAPVGRTGKDGTSNCAQPTKDTTSTTDVVKTIKAIEYMGKYLPVAQLIIENEVGCGANHWHAARGVVKATDGTMVPDPGPQCGYGKVKDKPVMEVKE